MVLQQTKFKRAAPWLVSGVSSCYVMLRARRLSRAKPSRASLLRFLRDQADLLVVLGGSPIVWYLSRRRAARSKSQTVSLEDASFLLSGSLHRLRQVFTGLILGLAVLMRKAAEEDLMGVKLVVRRLNRIALEGVDILGALDEICLVEVLEPAQLYTALPSNNGSKHL